MRKWSISHGRDGFKLEVYDEPLWATLTVDASERVCALTRHWWCGGGAPSFLWSVPAGRPKRDADGELENSMGSLLFTSFNWAMSIDFRHQSNKHEVPITDELGNELWGSSYRWWEEDDDNDD